MTTTKFHRRLEVVTAWQYQPGGEPPHWVAPHLADIPGQPNDRILKNYHGIRMSVSPGDYLIRLGDTDSILAVVGEDVSEAAYQPEQTVKLICHIPGDGFVVYNPTTNDMSHTEETFEASEASRPDWEEVMRRRNVNKFTLLAKSYFFHRQTRA